MGRTWGQLWSGELLPLWGPVRFCPGVHGFSLCLTSNHRTALVQTLACSWSSDWRSAAEGLSVLTRLIRNHQFTFKCVETTEGPTFTFYSGLSTLQGALKEASLPSALLQFNFTCKRNLPQGISYMWRFRLPLPGTSGSLAIPFGTCSYVSKSRGNKLIFHCCNLKSF